MIHYIDMCSSHHTSSHSGGPPSTNCPKQEEVASPAATGLDTPMDVERVRGRGGYLVCRSP